MGKVSVLPARGTKKGGVERIGLPYRYAGPPARKATPPHELGKAVVGCPRERHRTRHSTAASVSSSRHLKPDSHGVHLRNRRASVVGIGSLARANKSSFDFPATELSPGETNTRVGCFRFEEGRAR